MSKSFVALLTVGTVVVGGSLMSSDSEPSVTHENPVIEIQQPIQQQLIQPIKKAEPAPRCHSSYSGCLKPNSGDYDCAGGTGNGPNYTGSVEVLGPDVFDLDRDNDGWGCE